MTLHLSERQRQILELMAQGHGNRRIGEHLYITEDTVKTHAVKLFRALHARDRAHAVARGFELGHLSLPGDAGAVGELRQVREELAKAAQELVALRVPPPKAKDCDQLPGDVEFVRAFSRVRVQLEAARDEIAELRREREAAAWREAAA